MWCVMKGGVGGLAGCMILTRLRLRANQRSRVGDLHKRANSGETKEVIKAGELNRNLL